MYSRGKYSIAVILYCTAVAHKFDGQEEAHQEVYTRVLIISIKLRGKAWPQPN